MKKICAIMIALTVACTFMPAMDGGEVQAAAKPAKVKITKAVKTNQMVDLKWKKAKGAKKYQIFMKKGKGKWKKIKTVKAKTRKFKKNGLKWSTKYAFKVRAINGKKKGAFSKTYAGKIRTKTTIQKVIKQKDLQQLRSMVENEFTGYETDVNITGNRIVFYVGLMDLKEDYTDDQIAMLKAEFDKGFGKAQMKKSMHKSIIQVQNKIGIVGITYKWSIFFHGGEELTSHVYK